MLLLSTLTQSQRQPNSSLIHVYAMMRWTKFADACHLLSCVDKGIRDPFQLVTPSHMGDRRIGISLRETNPL